MDDLTRQFVRFREHADVAALGAVFDAAAGRLLSLALQLCGNASDAEDLLQATFVRAMQKAATFDAHQPLLPWLCGILAGEASNLRRGTARRRSEPLPELVDGEHGPLAASERGELLVALRAHVEQLPDEQRQVLLLQLQHGLSPTAIAEVLGAAPGTVRMRIHRGLAALRRLLPAGLASLLVWSLPSRGLAAVRQAVLQQARVALPAAAVVGGGVVMKKVAVMAAVVAVCAFAWFAIELPWQAALNQPPIENAVPAVAMLPAANAANATAVVLERAPERAAVALPASPPVASAVASAAPTGALHVRVVHHDDGSPGPITKVGFTPRRGDVDDYQDEVFAHTDANGERTLRELPVGDADVAVGGDRQRVTITANATTEVMVRMHWRGIAVRGRVVHADGQPAGGAFVVLGTAGGTSVVGTAAADGTFALAAVYPYDKVGAVLAGQAPSLLQSLQPERLIELVLAGPAAVLAGTVVDATGGPVVGAHVAASSRAAQRQWRDPRGMQLEVAADQRLRTDAQGAFRFETAPGPLQLDAAAEGFAPFADLVEATVAPSAPRVVRLQAAAPLRGQVRDQHDAAVAGVAVQLGGSNSRWRRTGDDGSFAFMSAPPGRVEVRVKGDAIETLDAVRDPESPGELLLRVQRRPRQPLRLVDDLGAPLVGWLAVTTALRGELRTTDADGRVTLIAPMLDRGRIELRTPSGSGLLVDWPDGCVPDVEATLVVVRRAQPNAVVCGRVLDAAGQPIARGSIDVRRVDLPGRHLRGAQFAVGAFCTDPLVAGDYELAILAVPGNSVVSARLAVRALLPDERRDLGDVRLPATGQLAFRLLHRDGAPIVDPAVFLFDERGDEARAPSIDGSPRPWPVGRYRYRAMVDATLWVRGECEVRAVGATVVDLLLQPAVRCHIRFPVPTPAWGAASKVHYVLRQPDGAVYDEDDFDLRDELPMSFAPTVVPGVWRLDLTTDLGLRFTGSFTIDDLRPRVLPINITVQPTR